MWQWTIGTVLPLAGTFAVGALGWFVTQFGARPLVRFLELKQQTHEHLFFTANVGERNTDPARFDRACDDLRRTAAQLSACGDTMLKPVRWLIQRRGYDVEEAVRGLTGLSNSLDKRIEKALHRDTIEAGLKLKPTYTPDQIRQFKQLLSGGERD